MKTFRKLSKPRSPLRLRKSKRQTVGSDVSASDRSSMPRITNETVAAHREEVLSSARKYIYPLQHSKHKIVIISSALFISVVVAFFAYCIVSLYKLQSNSTFVYRATQVIPFPVARAGNKFVAYENYLFELRHYTHYYETQQKLDFKGNEGKQQLAAYKKRALDKVINDAYVKQLAVTKQIRVSDQEVNDQLSIIRNQNRLGANDQAFRDALRDNFGWSVNDFKRQLRQELLTQKVVAALDTDTQSRAQKALQELKSGADFAATAKKYSDEPTSKAAGGEFGFMIDKNNRDLSPQTTHALFKLKKGEISDIVDTGYNLEILKNLEVTADKIRGAHIVLTFKDINTYINNLKDQQKAHTYIKA